MRSTAPLSTGMQIAIPLSGASAADTGRVALPESPCCRGRHDFPDEPLSGDDQGALGVRAGASAAQGRTRPRPFRGAFMDRVAPARADDMPGLRLLAAATPRRAGPDRAGEK